MLAEPRLDKLDAAGEGTVPPDLIHSSVDEQGDSYPQPQDRQDDLRPVRYARQDMLREGPGICFIDHLLGKRDRYPVVRYKIGDLEH
ncbi:hypothetical protein AA0111_g11096 [Alternaria arborescens]|uniref:hypothetical protein n=1 Tax=Alternaria arborescens TaxID=156630 RepID=UPI001074FC66|nr:hypothetical protein AA0111_g11096 [Alternaria arborescens]RYO17518.1 hypothetical protein AA0111_g11096 [Alternaria arborescens]